MALSCPIDIKVSFTGSLFAYWEHRFANILKLYFDELQSIRKPDDNSDVDRRIAFDYAKKQVRILWDDNIRVYGNIDDLPDEAARHLYRTCCMSYFTRYVYQYPDDVIVSAIEDRLRSKDELEELDDLIEDKFLQNLWNTYGIHKLNKIRFEKSRLEN